MQPTHGSTPHRARATDIEYNERPTTIFAPWVQSLTAYVLASATTSVVPTNTTGNTWPYQTFRTVNFTPPVLDISHSDVRRQSHYGLFGEEEEYLFFAPDGATAYQMAPLIMSMDGELVWNGPSTHANGFGVQDYLGEDVLVWWNGTVYHEPIGRGNGAVYMLDQHYEQIHKTTLAGNFVEHVPNATFPSNIDLHEINLTENGTMLVAGNNVTQTDLTSLGGPPDGWVVEAQFYEIDIATNEVLFAWKSLDHLDQIPLSASVYPLGSEGYTGATQPLAWGYFHINAVGRLPGGGYILSSRFLCSAIAIDLQGNVKWRLQGQNGGDFTLGPGAEFCYQHDIRAYPTHQEQQPGGHNSNTSLLTLHMHDNANSPIENNTNPTNGKTLHLDLTTKTATLHQTYLNTSGPIFSTAQGNYQALPNGNVFLGHGWIPVLEEFTSKGEILSTIQFGLAEEREGGGFYSLLKPTLSYRAFKQRWVGCPLTKPDVVVEKKKKMMDSTSSSSSRGGKGGDHHDEEETFTVYVSQNGATEVVSWEVWGGESAKDLDGLRWLRTVGKKGFETAVEVKDCAGVKYIQVRPVMRHGGRGRGRGRVRGTECRSVDSAIVAVR
ncbi:hypothetical protein B0A50_07120 [Salinomyces thailandicus]|uniref:Arylsulfotransferase n=1 Tax=Salinomyces thailandicus TaxID=706561 RepID=A0A4U0TP39_9PEZI|nr:hypothetical protein B0A50_07120 [Salinomyces thailandica]